MKKVNLEEVSGGPAKYAIRDLSNNTLIGFSNGEPQIEFDAERKKLTGKKEKVEVEETIELPSK